MTMNVSSSRWVDAEFLSKQTEFGPIPWMSDSMELLAAECGKTVGFFKLSGFRIVNLYGASGGWPEIMFYGEKDKLAELESWYDGDSGVHFTPFEDEKVETE